MNFIDTEFFKLISRISELEKGLSNLKILFEIPRLYICDCLSDIRAEIDLAFNEKIISSKKNELLIQNWISMIELIYLYEEKCLDKFKTNKFSTQISDEASRHIDLIEIKINLTKLKLNAQTETNEEIYLELENLENEIYDLSYKLEKLVFLNMTYVFVEKKNCKIENYFDSMNNNTTTGKLIIIKNEYFGKHGISRFKK